VLSSLDRELTDTTVAIPFGAWPLTSSIFFCFHFFNTFFLRNVCVKSQMQTVTVILDK